MLMYKQRKKIAALFLCIFFVELFTPTVAHALTSGPAQPEVQKFEPAGVSDLVDLFSGDLKYNIPLLDVGGYPVNLSYASGTSMEDEASWVGTGWTLNPGAVNRTLRGLPDEFDGSKGSDADKVTKVYSKKPFRKVGGSLLVKTSALAWEFGNPSLKLNVYKDSYYGAGAGISAGVSYSLSSNMKTPWTAGLDLNVSSDVREGVNVNPTLSISKFFDYQHEVSKASLSGGFHYNTRAGLKSLNLGASFNTSRELKDAPDNLSSSAVHYYGQSYTPDIPVNTTNKGYTFSLDVGPSIFGGYIGVGGTGYSYEETINEPVSEAPAYGYLNYHKGRSDMDALVDFNREKDGVFLTSAPAIPVPVVTQDFFVASGQTGAQQFRPHFNGNYIVFDKAHHNTSNNTSAGLTVGAINVFKGGARVEWTNGGSNTNKWTSDNNNKYLDSGEVPFGNDALEEPVYFKQVGELTRSDNTLYKQIGTETEKVMINGKSAWGSTPATYKKLLTRNSEREIGAIHRVDPKERAKRGTIFSYLTAEQASKYGVDKKINGEPRFDYDPGIKGTYRKKHHISEVTVTDKEGKRMVYGIPVYNITQSDVTFSVDEPSDLNQAKTKGIIDYDDLTASRHNAKGRDHLYSKSILPSYTTAHLLTGILSPDYIDVTGNGITDDDQGTAVKFNYSSITRSGTTYKWRTPYGDHKANYNEGFNKDKKDNKASYVYGEKEIWYLKSVESKTQIAIFETSDREDGLGVKDENGGKDTSLKLKKLDRIKLYSKAEWLQDAVKAVPIKVVHFEYDYSLYPNVSNNSGNEVPVNGKNSNERKGKLTLTKVYFTFGKSTRGITNPYEFVYDVRPIKDAPIANMPSMASGDAELEDQYLERQTDRWGTYKKSFYNHTIAGARTLNNPEFPYSLQENDNAGYRVRQLADLFASKWQLTQITTPSGSVIHVDYESDDYAYVQDKRAMQMCFIKGVDNVGTANGLIHSNRLVIELPYQVASPEEFKKVYLQGADGRMLDKLFFKVAADLDKASQPNEYEYVHGYAEINPNDCSLIDSKTVLLGIRQIGGVSPIAKAAWQLLRTELPQFAYDNYDNSDVSFGEGAVRSLFQSVLNFKELFQSFEEKAEKKHFGDQIDLNKSIVRLYNPGFRITGSDGKIKNYCKTGGGSRVHRILISDEWSVMSGSSGKTAQYGQVYEYTVKDKDGKIWSSGVASYEPQIGNEENPFHEPVSFTEKVHWSSDKYHFIEKPFCESYFPAASVGYSKVTVTSVGNEDTGGAPKVTTGWVENDFYTSKDFPTLVDYLPLDQVNYENNFLLKLFTATSINKVVTSQGFRVELNDMHGKPRAVKVYNKGGDLLSSSEYFYSVKDQNAEVKELDNAVDVLEAGGTISPKVTLGMEEDFVTDVRESQNENTGTSVGAYTGGMSIPPFIPFFPYIAVNFNHSKSIDTYHSVAAVKVINRFGILKKTRTMQNGSTIEAENLLWDGETGDVVLSRTQNEFDKYTYALNYQAYMGYEGMGSAYRNQGGLFNDLQLGVTGIILNPSPISLYFSPGDELVSLDGTARKGWVIQSPGDVLRLVDEQGNYITAGGRYLLLRSGRRNMLTASAGTVITMVDPRNGNAIDLNVAKQVLDAKAVLYKEEWPIPLGTIYENIDPNKYYWAIKNEAYYTALCKVLLSTDQLRNKRYIFSAQTDRVKLGDLIRRGIQLGYFPAGSDPLTDFFRRCDNATTYQIPNPDDVYYYVGGLQEQTPGFYTIPGYSPPAVLEMNGHVICGIEFQNLTSTAYQFLNYSSMEATIISQQASNCEAEIQFSPHGDYCAVPGCYFKIRYYAFLTDATEECVSPIDHIINPYRSGVLGNWRPCVNFSYTVGRTQNKGIADQAGGTDIRNSGYYSTFTPFWVFQNSGMKPNFWFDNRWVWSSQSVYFDEKGNEVENVDALNRYGSALFGYQQSLAVAVGANARRNEIAFDGFEDYDYRLQGSSSGACPSKGHFDFPITTLNKVVRTTAHTGKYSYQLGAALSIQKDSGERAAPITSVLDYDASGHYILKRNNMAKGLALVPGKKYLLSLWVNEHDDLNSSNKVQKLNVSINGSNANVSTLTVPVVEGWKRLEIPFIAGHYFRLDLVPSGTIELDDFRILPFEGQLNSYVYDDLNLRLLAQLDENNFATFYEYDEAGALVRVKKETERGILTLKENRVAFRKR